MMNILIKAIIFLIRNIDTIIEKNESLMTIEDKEAFKRIKSEIDKVPKEDLNEFITELEQEHGN
jgi:hypothetical protein